MSRRLALRRERGAVWGGVGWGGVGGSMGTRGATRHERVGEAFARGGAGQGSRRCLVGSMLKSVCGVAMRERGAPEYTAGCVCVWVVLDDHGRCSPGLVTSDYATQPRREEPHLGPNSPRKVSAACGWRRGAREGEDLGIEVREGRRGREGGSGQSPERGAVRGRGAGAGQSPIRCSRGSTILHSGAQAARARGAGGAQRATRCRL